MSLLALLVIIVVVGFGLVGIYNGIVAKNVACDNGLSQITVQLKRRQDLIPNLVETVKGYAAHERETLDAVIKARNSAASVAGSGDVAAQAQAESALSGTLRQLFALSEAYPDLKANQNFLQLQGELGNTENEISAARQGYNAAVNAFNTAIAQVPGNFVAGFGGFVKRPFFELSAEEQKAAEAPPKVSFS